MAVQEAEFTNFQENLENKTIDVPNYTLYFLQGSVKDDNVDLVKQRLVALCENTSPEEYQEIETKYILGDLSKITGLTNKLTSNTKVGQKRKALDSTDSVKIDASPLKCKLLKFNSTAINAK